jgi:hypothetical protein
MIPKCVYYFCGRFVSSFPRDKNRTYSDPANVTAIVLWLRGRCLALRTEGKTTKKKGKNRLRTLALLTASVRSHDAHNTSSYRQKIKYLFRIIMLRISGGLSLSYMYKFLWPCAECRQFCKMNGHSVAPTAEVRTPMLSALSPIGPQNLSLIFY